MTGAFQETIDDTPRRLLRSTLGKNSSDPKLDNTPAIVYVAPADHAAALARVGDPAQVTVFDPAAEAAQFLRHDAPHGLLYLPYPYLVPGGRFNEMYGWDTAFPVFAWADALPQMMREQVDNQLYQIRMYGKVLNANRTYYLSRSQPPLIAAMVLRVYKAAQSRPWRDFDPDGVFASADSWLAEAQVDLAAYYTYWTTGDRLAEGIALSRYWDEGDGAAAEVMLGEPGHYDHAAAHFRTMLTQGGDAAEIALFFDGKTEALTPLYFRADRAMRASGLDPTGHWGYGGLQCLFHAPVCLNALLYQMEKDMAEIAGLLHREADIPDWKDKAAKRLSLMKAHLLDQDTGIFHDYNFRTKQLNTEPFATFFHALWAGLYEGDAALAAKAAGAVLAKLEAPHGLLTSNHISGSQWDAPYGWPPLQYFAFEGLTRAGLKTEGKRIAEKFLTLAKSVFAENNALFEKYNMQYGNAEVSVVNGYSINVSEKGTFLWTAAVLKLAQGME